MEAVQRFLEAQERWTVGSEDWADATADACDMLRLEQCDEAATPDWWNDEGLKALSARVLRAAPNKESAIDMRAYVLGGDKPREGLGGESGEKCIILCGTCVDIPILLV